MEPERQPGAGKWRQPQGATAPRAQATKEEGARQTDRQQAQDGGGRQRPPRERQPTPTAIFLDKKREPKRLSFIILIL